MGDILTRAGAAEVAAAVDFAAEADFAVEAVAALMEAVQEDTGNSNEPINLNLRFGFLYN